MQVPANRAVRRHLVGETIFPICNINCFEHIIPVSAHSSYRRSRNKRRSLHHKKTIKFVVPASIYINPAQRAGPRHWPRPHIIQDFTCTPHILSTMATTHFRKPQRQYPNEDCEAYGTSSTTLNRARRHATPNTTLAFICFDMTILMLAVSVTSLWMAQ